MSILLQLSTSTERVGSHRTQAEHWRVRLLWAPWLSRCACGLDSWPCRYPESLQAPPDRLAARASRLEPTVGACSSEPVPPPSWNGPTLAFTPLLTPAQRWRGNGGRWGKP